ncbi:MAG: Uma2 family endonuclease, partial [Microcystaceae cyanobacterium]
MVSTLLESPIVSQQPFPPNNLESSEPPLESDLHRRQIDLLIRLLESYWSARQDFYVSGNVTIFYSPNQLKSEDFRGPDFFVVLNCDRRNRKSWTVWQENGLYPNLIIELLSSSTAKVDRGLKKEIYQNTFRTPDYFWFDPESLEFQGFHLIDGQYQPIKVTNEGLLWSQQLHLYLGINNQQLRFFTDTKDLILLPE